MVWEHIVTFPYVPVISSAGVGLFYGLLGWVDSTNDFSWFEFLTAVLPPIAVGMFAGYMDIPYAVAIAGTTGVGITKIVRKVIKVIYNKKDKILSRFRKKK